MANLAETAVPSTTLATSTKKFHTYVAPPKFEENIKLIQAHLSVDNFIDAAHALTQNTFKPKKFVVALIEHCPYSADPDGIVGQFMAEYAEFVRFGMRPTNIENRAVKISDFLKLSAQQNVRTYFKEKYKLLADIAALGATVPSLVVKTCDELEARMHVGFTREDWLGCGFEVKLVSGRQTVYVHRDTKESKTVYGEKPVTVAKSSSGSTQRRTPRDTYHKKGQEATQ